LLNILRNIVERREACHINVESAGVYACEGEPLHRWRYAYARIMGWTYRITLRGIDPGLINKSDLIVAMEPYHYEEIVCSCPDAEGKIVLWVQWRNPKGIDCIPDPYGKGSKSLVNALINKKACGKTVYNPSGWDVIDIISFARVSQMFYVDIKGSVKHESTQSIFEHWIGMRGNWYYIRWPQNRNSMNLIELLEWNEKVNLTSLVNVEDIIIQHYLDSLMPGKALGGIRD